MDVASVAVFVQAFSRQLLLVPPPPFPLLLLSICSPPSAVCHSAVPLAYEETFTQLLSFVCVRGFPSPSAPLQSLEREAEALKTSSTFHDLPCVHWQLLDCLTAPFFYLLIVPSLPAFASHPLASDMAAALRSSSGIWNSPPAIKVALLQVLINHICDCEWLVPQFEPLPENPNAPASTNAPVSFESQALGCLAAPVVTWLPQARKPEAYRHEFQPHSRIVPVTSDPWNRSVWAMQGHLIVTDCDGRACRIYWTPSSIAQALRSLACGSAMLPMRPSFTQALQWLLTWSRSLQLHPAFSFDSPKLVTWRNQHTDIRSPPPAAAPCCPHNVSQPAGRRTCRCALAFSKTRPCNRTVAAAACRCPPKTSQPPIGLTRSGASGCPSAPYTSAYQGFCSGAVITTTITITTNCCRLPRPMRRREFLYTSAHWVTALAAATSTTDVQLLLFELAAAVMPAGADPVWHSYDVLPHNYGRNFSSFGPAVAGAHDSDHTTPGMHHVDVCHCPAPTPFMGSWKARETPRDCGRTVFTWLRRRVTTWPRRRHLGDVRSLATRIHAADNGSPSAEGAAAAAAPCTGADASAGPVPCRDERHVPAADHHWSICLLDQLEAWEVMRLARSGGRGPSVAFSYPQGAAGPLHWGLRRHWMRCLVPQPPPPPSDCKLLGKCVAQLQMQPAAVAPLSQAELAFRMRQFERCLRLPVPHPHVPHSLYRMPTTTPSWSLCHHHPARFALSHPTFQYFVSHDSNKKDKWVDAAAHSRCVWLSSYFDLQVHESPRL
jgi:hypothetical protein